MTTSTDLLPNPPAVRWPDRHHPSRASAFSSNECVVPVPPERVWSWLVRAALWPSWSAGVGAVHFLSHAGPDLRDRSRFRARFGQGLSGVRLTCKVREFEPCARLAWDAHGPGVDAYRVTILTPAGGGTHVLLEESRSGWLTRLHAALATGGLLRQNQLWLEALAGRALSGTPPGKAENGSYATMRATTS